MVVKDAIVPWVLWTSWVYWHGDVRDLDNREHTEIHCLKAIAEVDGTNNITEIRGSEVKNDRMWYRIYLGFCAHREVWDLIRAGVPPLDPHPPHHLEDIPEPAIWSIFNTLVRACLILEYGAIEEQDKKPDWVPIVHRDFNDGNVLLDIRDPADPEFPNYPRARLADFGQAVRIAEGDPHNPYAYSQGGTRDWHPREQIPLKTLATLHPVKGDLMSGKTNVWGIGAVIMRLMSRDHTPKGPKFEDADGNYFPTDRPVFRNNGGPGGPYSIALRNLVQSCVAPNPDDRPDLRHLRTQILRFTTMGSGLDRAQGMRNGVHSVPPALVLHCTPEVEKYKIGFARQRTANGSWLETGTEDKVIA